MAEQFDKESTEKILQSDLDQARQEIGTNFLSLF